MNEMFAVHLKEWQERKRARTNKNVAILSGVQCVHKRNSQEPSHLSLSTVKRICSCSVQWLLCRCVRVFISFSSFTLFFPTLPQIQFNQHMRHIQIISSHYLLWWATPIIHQWTCAFSTLLRVNRCATHTNNTLW